MQELYPGERIYGVETTKGFVKPCLFVTMNAKLLEGSRNAVRKEAQVEIIRLLKDPDEEAALDFFEKVQAAFYPKLQVGDRHLNTRDFEADYIGDGENIPRIEFSLEYYQRMEKPAEKAALLRKLRIKEELKTWDYRR